ncbi:MAG: hypothetical protein ACFCUI_13735 [Bernardetiaceae bacterium]
MSVQKERRLAKQDRLQGSIFAAVLMLLLLGGLRTCQVWQMPDPPPERMGIVMDFGGLVQPQAKPTETKPATPPPQEEEVIVADNDLAPIPKTEEPKDKPAPTPSPDPEPTPQPVEEEQPEEITEEEEEPVPDTPPEEMSEQPADQAGSSLDIAGWRWEHPPAVDDDSPEVGEMAFDIILDSYGEVIFIKIDKRYGISLGLANRYKKAIEQLVFHPVGSVRPMQNTKGVIRIYLKRK